METIETGHVIELAKFRKQAGVSDADFGRALRSIDAFAQQQPGFLSRETGHDGKGGWIDVLRWQDMESSQAALKAAETSAICAEFFGLLDPQFGEMNHITVTHGCSRK